MRMWRSALRSRRYPNAAPTRSLLDTIVGDRKFSATAQTPRGGALEAFLSEASAAKALAIWFGDRPFDSLDRLARAITTSIGAIDDLVNRQLNAVLHNPAFQKLEASWRGLSYLVDRLDEEADNSIQIRVLNVTWREIEGDFERAIEFDQSQLFKKVYSQEFDMPGGTPFGVLIGDYALHLRPTPDHPHDDVGVLRHLSQVAAAAFCPWVMGASPDLFGLEDFGTLERNINFESVFREQEYLKWQSLRDSEDARFVGVLLPRVLMRTPYRDDGTRVDGFRFQEHVTGPDRSKYLWGNPAYAFAGVLIRAFAESGWLADIRGVQRDMEGSGLITTLPVEDFATDAAGVAPKCSAEVVITDTLEKTLSEFGFMAICDCKDTSYSALYSAPSIQKPRRYSTPDATRNARISALLQFMLCVSRFAHYVKVIARDKIGSMKTPEEFQRLLEDWLTKYVTSDADARADVKARHPLREASVEVHERRGSPGVYQCVIRLAPHYELDDLCASVQLATELAPARP